MKAQPRFPSRRFEHVEPEILHFIKQLLDRDPERRPTAEEAMQHPWIEQNLKITPKICAPELLETSFLSFSMAANQSSQVIEMSPVSNDYSDTISIDPGLVEQFPECLLKTYFRLATPRIDSSQVVYFRNLVQAEWRRVVSV
jgi:serine/threonine protein kinase